jgi:hypothetical protein
MSYVVIVTRGNIAAAYGTFKRAAEASAWAKENVDASCDFVVSYVYSPRSVTSLHDFKQMAKGNQS